MNEKNGLFKGLCVFIAKKQVKLKETDGKAEEFHTKNDNYEK